jgi:hypothetical protein
MATPTKWNAESPLDPCPHWELDPHQIFPWVQLCRWFDGCSGCRLDEVEICRWQGLSTTPETSAFCSQTCGQIEQF